MAADGVRFKPGTDVVSQEVYAAFHDEPLTVAFPAVTMHFLMAPAAGIRTYKPPEYLDATQVQGMLAEKGGSWTLAVQKDDSTGVLDGKHLKDAWNQGSDLVELPLRSPTSAEHLVLADSAALYGPSASWTRIKDAVAYPVTQIALVATAAGLFGLLALQDDIARLWAMKVATIIAALAAVFSIYWGQWHVTEEVKPARLDLLRARQKQMFTDAIRRTRFGLGLLLLAVAFAIVASWPTGGSAQSASIGSPTVAAATQGMKTVSLTVSWTELDESIARVSSTISGSAEPTITSKPTGKDSVDQPLQTTVPARETSVRVVTHAVNSQGQQVGVGYTKLVNLPASD